MSESSSQLRVYSCLLPKTLLLLALPCLCFSPCREGQTEGVGKEEKCYPESKVLQEEITVTVDINPVERGGIKEGSKAPSLKKNKDSKSELLPGRRAWVSLQEA